MAAPHVAGAAALLASYNPNLSAASLKATLMNSVDVLGQWNGLVKSGGRLNVAKALQNPTVCTFTLAQMSQSASSAGGTFSFDITAPPNCDFSIISNTNWITVAGNGLGSGNGTITFSVSSNSGSPRDGTITVAGRTFTVNQAAAALSYEADVAPRTGGDGIIDATDVQQIERFSVGLGRPFLSNEFQRADSAPKASGGDGAVDALDVQQAELYSVGVGGRPLANGPTPTPTPVRTNVSEGNGKGKSRIKKLPATSAPRTLTVESTGGSLGDTVAVAISVEAVGDEFGYTFGIDYDSTKLRLTGVASGGISGQAQPQTNIEPDNSNPDALGLSVRFGGGAIPATGGVKQVLLRLTFDTIGGAGTTSPIRFTSTPTNQATTSQMATRLDTKYIDGTITINGTTATSSISGRGNRNMVATLTDANQTVNTTTASSLGHYRFDELRAGQNNISNTRAMKYNFIQSSRFPFNSKNTDSIDFATNIFK